MPLLGLALGGGGVRGLAHLGVLRVLEREGLAPGALAGTSMGAIIAALYALSPSLRDVEQRMGEFFTRFGPALSRLTSRVATSRGGIAVEEPSLLEAGVFHHHFDELIPDVRFEDARVPLAIVAVDLVAGEEVVFSSGPVRPAVLGSVALPGVFPPIAHDGRLLVDGGWTSRIPVDAVRRIGADRVLGVEVSENADNPFVSNQPKTGLQVVLRAAEITRNHLARLAERSADILLIPPTGHVALHEAQRGMECVKIGEDATAARIEEIRRLLTPRA